MWMDRGLVVIASAIGNPVALDAATKERRRLLFASVCVEVSGESVMPPSVTIRIRGQDFIVPISARRDWPLRDLEEGEVEIAMQEAELSEGVRSTKANIDRAQSLLEASPIDVDLASEVASTIEVEASLQQKPRVTVDFFQESMGYQPIGYRNLTIEISEIVKFRWPEECGHDLCRLLLGTKSSKFCSL
ncbi:unnamed protein product [Citrullus colocynthis]|uniref:Uncharacterized protein n=1 Tax=Citrullus colocynthis TaxID=252529 RepID=A0ABP0Y3N9_9ROSI